LDKQWHHNFETWLDGSTRDPANPELESGRVEEKIGKEKIRYNVVDPARPGQKLGCNSLTFDYFFLLKQYRFDFKKKLTRTIQ
jgi:hypothetical protein